MSFKFDEKYVEFLKTHCRADFTSALDEYLDWIEGGVLCGCEHGCNETSLENTVKLLMLIRALRSGASQSDLDSLATKDALGLIGELHTQKVEEEKKRALKD